MLLATSGRVVIEYALETESELKKKHIEEPCGKSADALDKIEVVSHKNGQWDLALVALTEEEARDLVMGVGSGAEAWRMLVWIMGLCGGWQKSSSAEDHHHNRKRCRTEELAGVIEKWEASVRKFERQGISRTCCSAQGADCASRNASGDDKQLLNM